MYSSLYTRKTGYPTVKPMLYFVRESVVNSDASISINKERIDDFSNQFNEFEDGLKSVLLRLFDESIPFTRTIDEKKCEFCAYREMCRK